VEVLGEPGRVELRSLRHHDEGVALPPLVGPAQLAGERLGIRLHLGDGHGLCPAGDPRHEGEVAAVAAHHLDEERPAVGGGGGLEAVDGLQGHVEGSVHPNRDLRAGEVVVDRGRHADDGEPHPGELVSAGLGAVPSDHDQGLDPLPSEGAKCPPPALLGAELRAAGAPEDRPPELEDPPHVPRPEGHDLPADEAGVASPHPPNFPAPRDPRADHGADRGVHPRRVAPAREDGDPLHRDAFSRIRRAANTPVTAANTIPRECPDASPAT